MDELDKGLAISLTGPAREEALRRCREQIRSWGESLPPAEPLVLDFGLGEFERTGLIEFWIANEARAGYCGKYLFLFDGQSCPHHRHASKHETFFVVRGKVTMHLADGDREMGPGEVLAVETGTEHGFTGCGPALLLEISQPCEIDDNAFRDPRIPIGRGGE
jgi:D-lyxose ketol-isomerase